MSGELCLRPVIPSASGAASTTPQSGTSYAAGFAYGFPCVTQPVSDFVLYWYQSTPSVIGMIGTSRTIAASSWLTIACCFAELVVAA